MLNLAFRVWLFLESRDGIIALTRIRLAGEEDLPAILAISNWAAKHTAANFAVEPERLEDWRKDWLTTRREYPWLVSVDGGGEVVGFAKASPWKGRCAYNWTAEVTVYVRSEHHRQGRARALYGRLIEVLKAQGYRTLLAGITTPNPASVRLHESFGFHRVGGFQRVGWKFGSWHDVGYWEAILDADPGPPAQIRPVEEALRAASSTS